MDQPATRPDTWPATESAPRCGGGDLGDTKGLNAARPDDLPAALSHGRLETGPGGGPVSRCLQKPPLGGGTSAPIAQDAVGANRPSWPQRRAWRADSKGGPARPPFSLPKKSQAAPVRTARR